MANVLDDLFQWASQQPPQNYIWVSFAMATNELTRNNLVSYAEGTLYYHPARSTGWFWFSADFASQPNGITQYFSDRRAPIPNSLIPGSPFSGDTDPLDVTISAPSIFQTQYAITIHSSKWNFQFTFNPNFDAATGIILGSHGSSLITMSLCNRGSEPPPK